MVETQLRWFRRVERRLVDSIVRRVDQMKGSQIAKCKGRLRKSIRQTIKKDFEIHELDRDII